MALWSVDSAHSTVQYAGQIISQPSKVNGDQCVLYCRSTEKKKVQLNSLKAAVCAFLVREGDPVHEDNGAVDGGTHRIHRASFHAIQVTVPARKSKSDSDSDSDSSAPSVHVQQVQVQEKGEGSRGERRVWGGGGLGEGEGVKSHNQVR